VTALLYTSRRIRRHARWLRTQGWRRLVEEDRLDPAARVREAFARYRWRRAHAVAPGQAVPVYVVGLQRSGTNMLLRGFATDPSVEVRGENDSRVFHRFRLRADATLVSTVLASRHRFVLVKPLCDTHRVDDLLALPGPVPGRAVWLWRDVEDRARSEVAKFGPSNLDALRAIAAGTIGDGWQGQRLSASARSLIGDFDLGSMSPHTGAALFWYVRNELFFRLGLDRRSDVLLLSYDDLVAAPEKAMRGLCDLLGMPFHEGLCAHISVRAPQRRPLDLDPRVRALCDELTGRLTRHG
jgi:hypothetical protein